MESFFFFREGNSDRSPQDFPLVAHLRQYDLQAESGFNFWHERTFAIDLVIEPRVPVVDTLPEVVSIPCGNPQHLLYTLQALLTLGYN